MLSIQVEDAKREWDLLKGNDVHKNRAILYAEKLRKQYPEEKNKYSKAKIPYSPNGDLILTDDNYGTWNEAARQYIKTPVVYKPSVFWCDAFETIEFMQRYKADTIVRIRSLISNVIYYISVDDYNELFSDGDIRNGIFVGRWGFEKNGKTTKVKKINLED